MIPTVNVLRLAARREFEGRLEFEFEPEADLLDIPFVGFSGPVHAELFYEILEDGVEIEGAISFTLTGACSRCLEHAERRYTGDVEAVFVRGKGDGEKYGYTNGVVVLDEMLRDAIIFALPSRHLCGSCGEPDGIS